MHRAARHLSNSVVAGGSLWETMGWDVESEAAQAGVGSLVLGMLLESGRSRQMSVGARDKHLDSSTV